MTEYLTVKDAAGIIRVSERTILRWLQDGSLPAVRIGRTIRFNKQRLLMELDRRQYGVRPQKDDPALG